MIAGQLQFTLLVTSLAWGALHTGLCWGDDQPESVREENRDTERRSGPAPLTPPASTWGYATMGSPLSMIRREDVRKELELSEDQSTKALALVEKLWTDTSFPSREELKGLSREEQRKKFSEAMHKRFALERQLQSQLFDLMSESQTRRLKELGIQRRGLNALLDPEVSAQLGLDDEQKKTIWKALTAKPPRPIGTTGIETRDPKTLSPEERKKQFADFVAKAEESRKVLEAKVMASLTSEQKQKFESLKGSKFAFAPFTSVGRFPTTNEKGTSTVTK